MKIKLLHNVPSAIFEAGESLLLIGFGYLVGVKWHEVLSLLLVFMIVRNVIGKGKHYRHPSECLVWSLLVFGTSVLLIRINYILSLLLVGIYAVAQTAHVDAREMYMWKGRHTNYDYINRFIKRMEGTVALRTFEENLEEFDPRIYNVYKYRLKKGYSFGKIEEILNIDNRRISEILKALELAINLYFNIKKP